MSDSISSYPIINTREGRISRHPWLFNMAIEKPKDPIRSGSIVDVVGKNNEFLGRGLYNARARIAVRVLTRSRHELIDQDFFDRRVASALELRKRYLSQYVDNPLGAFRLVHGEADQLSGVVVDIYGSLAVLQFLSSGMFYRRDLLINAIKKHLKISNVYYYAEKHAQKQESFDCHAPAGDFSREIVENGVRYAINPEINHKTGFFLDQRQNRRELATLSAGKRVLDICTFTGGFALSAKVAGGASEVTAIDRDPAVIELAQTNAKLNNVSVDFLAEDLYPWLKQDFTAATAYDIVVLDPAKLTKSSQQVRNALHNYKEMNALAMRAVKPGGLLLSCSCTGLVSETDFIASIRKGAQQANRDVQIIKISGADIDHPVLIDAPESRYLKAVWCRVL